jgi:hypothetical protein
MAALLRKRLDEECAKRDIRYDMNWATIAGRL